MRPTCVLPAGFLLLALTAPSAAAQVPSSASDASGDCVASPCADLVGASVDIRGTVPLGDGLTLDPKVVFRFDTPFGWTENMPSPQVWIWRAGSPDTGPPDATIGGLAGGSAGVTIADDPTWQPESIGYADHTPLWTSREFTVSIRFLAALGGRFRWRATLPADSRRTFDPVARPVDPQPADAAPDQGSVEFAPSDRDGDKYPDAGDPCPDEAHRDPAPGWENGSNYYGCPVTPEPFSREMFLPAAQQATKAFRAKWANRRARARAMRRREIKVRFVVPAGVTRVRMSAQGASGLAARSASVLGERVCDAGPCVVKLKVDPDRVREYARKPLLFVVGAFTISPFLKWSVTSLATPIRMPLRR